MVSRGIVGCSPVAVSRWRPRPTAVLLEKHGRSSWDVGWFAARKSSSPEQTGLGADALESWDGGSMNINTFQPAGRQARAPQQLVARE